MAATTKRFGAEQAPLRVLFAAGGGEVLGFAAGELVLGLKKMLREEVSASGSYELGPRQLLILIAGEPRLPPPELAGDAYAIAQCPGGIALRGGSERAVVHAVYKLFEQLGAHFPLGRPAEFPPLDRFRLLSARPTSCAPAFDRRAFASDLMTWNYSFADRLGLHLSHDREFIPWMARQGINAFFYIRHAHDTRYRIDELAGLHPERGIAEEYGGHITHQLLPRERFKRNPEYFPADAQGSRLPGGNLCVSNPDALAIVTANALEQARLNRDSEVLHLWGADVRRGAWCRCAQCAALTPQLQYMKMVNAAARAIAEEPLGTKVAYLAYHDTLTPDPALRPERNVWFEWAPRERCYRHAIDDPDCETNGRYLESLKRYIDLFAGRGHVFEYYADAILFGGIAFATPSTIARDLSAYHALGIRSISCLTFGAYSVLAYPVNLLTFARCALDLRASPDAALCDAAADRHPECAAEMVNAYRAIARASAAVLTYGDVLHPLMDQPAARQKYVDLDLAISQFRTAIEAAYRLSTKDPILVAERELWRYGAASLGAISDFLAAGLQGGEQARVLRADAISKLRSALDHIRAIAPEAKGTWGAYDLEWIHQLWLDALQDKAASSIFG